MLAVRRDLSVDLDVRLPTFVRQYYRTIIYIGCKKKSISLCYNSELLSRWIRVDAATKLFPSKDDSLH